MLLSFFSVPLSLFASSDDSTMVKPKRSFINIVSRPFVKLFADVDTAYIEPNHYNFQAMVQNRFLYESYSITDNVGNSIMFVPEPSLKIGPYAGWSLIFLGVSVDVLHIKDDNRRKEWDVSLYTLPIGIDIYYRQSGDDYRLKNIQFADKTDGRPLENTPFSDFKSSVSGADIYYIFNHKRFSYPAAFNQSTQQKLSCGSALAGIGFTRHTLEIDWNSLNQLATNKLGVDVGENFDSNRLFEKIVYTDLSLSGGYAYNWVFAKNWLFAASLKLALSYKSSLSESVRGFDSIGESLKSFRDFKFTDLTIDGVGRFGLVYSNGKWFAGASAIVNSYNYSKQNFSTNNMFGTFNVYAGINIGLKKKYKQNR